MQSYCSFSIGGTLAVNAHGITTDHCFAESVVEMRLARVSTKGKVQVIECRPMSAELRKKSASGELFSLALGGYGLFGVITEVVLKVVDNVQLELDSLQLPISADTSEFVRIYDNCRGAVTDDSEDQDGAEPTIGKLEIKLARLNTINLESASLYVLKRSSPLPTVSNLPSKPREMSMTSRLLYKWALPLFKEARYRKEESSGKALDWSRDDALTRNQLLFESAIPLARMYSPLLKRDDTFVLQEFFCPHHRFSEWIELAKPIFKEIEEQQHKYGQDLILLNTTIRFVEKDGSTFLSYSREENGSFAFVLYYRIKRVEEVEKRLGEFHNRFAQLTCELGGTFYLPYRKCYSADLLKAAYPMIEEFARLKEKFDSTGLFGNLWFEEYILPLTSNDYQTKWYLTETHEHTLQYEMNHPPRSVQVVENQKEFRHWIPRSNDPLLVRRNNSYRKLLRSKRLRSEFRQQFLVQIFNIADPDEVMRVMTRAAWDPANQNDIDIYKQIHFHFHGSATKTIGAKITQYWRAIQQLRQQKDEVTRQTLNILSKLGKVGSIGTYCCIGDHGKTVNSFVEALDIKGSLWVVHCSDDMKGNIEHTDTMKKMPALETVLERGSLDPVAHQEIVYDYMTDQASAKLITIPTGVVDLVTMNQGLHHIPIENLFDFLNEVKRIMSPNGTFIIREHDLCTDAIDGKVPYAMLDLAHSVFNAVTGVTVKDEMKEVRAFRSLLEWRHILEKVGFVDSLVYEVEDGDPTFDEMMCFSKSSSFHCKTKYSKVHEMPFRGGDTVPPVAKLVRSLLGQVPIFVTNNARDILEFLRQQLPSLRDMCSKAILEGAPSLLHELDISNANARIVGKKIIATFEPLLHSSFEQIITAVDGVLSMLKQSKLQDVYNFKNLGNIPELILILPYLEMKVHMEGESCNDLEKMLIIFVRKYIPVLLSGISGKSTGSSSPASALPHDKDTSTAQPKTVTGREIQHIIEKLEENIPGLLDPDIAVVHSGFNLPQQASLFGKFGGKDLTSACDNLAGYLTREIWTEMKVNLDAVKEAGELPTKSRLLSQSKQHPWHRVFYAFLKSPRVNLNQQGFIALKLIGLGDICTLYKKANTKKTEKEPTPCLDCDSEVTSCLTATHQSLESLGRDWTGDVIKRVITYNGKEEKCLYDVAEVLEAKFGYTSITSRKVDVTVELQSSHDRINKQVLEQKSIPPLLGQRKLGFLNIDESQLVQMRNKGHKQKEVGDSIRKSIVHAATLGNAGNNQLMITYRRLAVCDDKGRAQNAAVQSVLSLGYLENVRSAVKSTLDMLESKGIVRGDLHPSDGHYTWFKLNEWMQVEILDELVKSLKHTPWYRFPFFSFLRTYFSVFQQQCNIVQKKYGTVTAFGSEAFFVDLIPGIVMSTLFGQLQLLATPLKMAMPADGYKDHDQSRFREEIVLHTRQNNLNFFNDEIDTRILEVTILPQNFVVLSVPPFKAMGEILHKIAIRIPAARVLQISNQTEVQVRIVRIEDRSKDSEEEFARILSLAGVKFVMDYSFPSTIGSNDTTDNSSQLSRGHGRAFYSFEVNCLALLDLFRLCEMLPNHCIEQVYDFWN